MPQAAKVERFFAKSNRLNKRKKYLIYLFPCFQFIFLRLNKLSKLNAPGGQRPDHAIK